MARALETNKKLKELNLAQNRLSHLTGEALALALRHNTCILSLGISENTIPYKYTKEIQEWIDYNNFLRKQSSSS